MPDHMPSPIESVKVFVRSLLEQGVDETTIIKAVLALPDITKVTHNVTRNANALRQARFRANQALRRNVTVTSLARVVSSTSSTEIHGKKEKKKAADVTALRAQLETVLDPEHAAAVVEHRQGMGKGKELTMQGAKALAGKFAKCPDPNAAADTMLANGWRGIDPSWVEPRRPNGTGPPPKPQTGAAKLVELLKKPFEETYGRSNSEEPPRPPLRAIRDG